MEVEPCGWRSRLWPFGRLREAWRRFRASNWLRLHLGKGEFEGQRLLSPGLIQELQKPRVYVGASEFAEYSDVHYGLGFRSHRYRGERVVWHGGGFTGTNTLMMLLPDHGVGVAVLANNGMIPRFAPHILANYVIDRVCGKEPARWLDHFRERSRKFVAQQDFERQAEKASQSPAKQETDFTVAANRSAAAIVPGAPNSYLPMTAFRSLRIG